jgi:hypothetical protein
MNSFIAQVCLLLVATLAGGAARASTTPPSFRIECDLKGEHQGDPDRMAPERERALLQSIVAETYDSLPPQLRTIASQITFVIDHRHRELSKMLIGGWSAEDDDAYRYPDRDFYPKGTIKVSLTERFLELSALFRELASQPSATPALKAGARGWVNMVVAHELFHASQYHREPVRDLSHTGAFKDGLPDPVILEETAKKVAYEHEAYQFGRGFVTRAGMLALADAFDAFRAAHAPEFEVGARFGLCAQDGSQFLRREAEMVEHGGEFSVRQKSAIGAQYFLPKTALELKLLNDRLRALSSSSGDTSRISAIRDEQRKISATWDEYRGGTDASADIVLQLMPEMRQVIERYQAEQGVYRGLMAKWERP